MLRFYILLIRKNKRTLKTFWSIFLGRKILAILYCEGTTHTLRKMLNSRLYTHHLNIPVHYYRVFLMQISPPPYSHCQSPWNPGPMASFSMYTASVPMMQITLFTICLKLPGWHLSDDLSKRQWIPKEVRKTVLENVHVLKNMDH